MATNVTGPITGGTRGWPFCLPLADLDAAGYVAEEFFLDGTATAYEPEPGTDLGGDGKWKVRPGRTAPYRSRMLVVRPRDAEWQDLRPHFPQLPGDRQIVLLDVESIMTTCGFAVPLFEHKGDRSELLEFSCKMGERRMDEYRHERNQRSIDGMPTYLFDDQPE